MALAAAKAGSDVILHHGHSQEQARQLVEEIGLLGRKAWALQTDLSDPFQVKSLVDSAFSIAPVSAMINNAAIFADIDFRSTTLEDWNDHLQINLTAPFILGQGFAEKYHSDKQGRIINVLDWRALRPGKDHFAYTISKSALAAMTRSMALSLAPGIAVNGIALGAILPPPGEDFNDSFIKNVPMKRWCSLNELEDLIVFLLNAPPYITGEIIHLDGGRHLV